MAKCYLCSARPGTPRPNGITACDWCLPGMAEIEQVVREPAVPPGALPGLEGWCPKDPLTADERTWIVRDPFAIANPGGPAPVRTYPPQTVCGDEDCGHANLLHPGFLGTCMADGCSCSYFTPPDPQPSGVVSLDGKTVSCKACGGLAKWHQDVMAWLCSQCGPVSTAAPVPTCPDEPCVLCHHRYGSHSNGMSGPCCDCHTCSNFTWFGPISRKVTVTVP